MAGGIILIVVLLLEMCFLIPWTNLKAKESRCSGYVKGRVTDVDRVKMRRGLRKLTYYVPTVEYEVDGKKYLRMLDRTLSRDEYTAGDDFWVMYDPSDPKRVMQDDGFERFRCGFSAAVGVGLMAVTLFWAVFK